MAKQEKAPAKQETVAATTVDENNVMDSIRNGNLMKEKNVQVALAKIEEEKDAKQQEELKSLIGMVVYNNNKKLLQLRARRGEAKVTKEILTKTLELKDQVLAGKMTMAEYKEAKSSLMRYEREEMSKVSNTLDKETQELQNSYEGRYRYYWD